MTWTQKHMLAPQGVGHGDPFEPRAPQWFPEWRGQVVAIVASGPSATGLQALECRAGGCRIIAVNRGYELAPFCDVLYAADLSFWSYYPAALSVPALKVSALDSSALFFPEVHLVEIDPDDNEETRAFVLERPGFLGRGAGNSGFQAINLAIQFGAKQILLIGFDMHLDDGVHWHGLHPVGLINPEESRVKLWAEALDGQANFLTAADIELINLSPASALTSYPKMTATEALQQCQLQPA